MTRFVAGWAGAGEAGTHAATRAASSVAVARSRLMRLNDSRSTSEPR